MQYLQLPPDLPEDHPCRRAKRLRAALDDLLSGKAESQTRDGDQWLTFQKGDPKALQALVTQCERECAALMGQRATVRTGPRPLPNGCIPCGPFVFDPYRGRY